jgi:hypothetical protein
MGAAPAAPGALGSEPLGWKPLGWKHGAAEATGAGWFSWVFVQLAHSFLLRLLLFHIRKLHNR